MNRFRTIFSTAAVMAGILLTGLPNVAMPLSASASTKPIVIGATLQDALSPWFQWVANGMKQAAKEYGAKITIINTQGNPANEVSTVQDFTQQHVSAIVIGASSPTAAVGALKQAQGKGIKVVAYNSLVGTPGEFPFVGVDDSQLGAINGLAAKQYINSQLHGKANIAIVYEPKYGEVSLSRTTGFEAVMKSVPGAKIVTKQIAEAQEDAQNTVTNMLTAHPEINVIDTWNETSFEGALAAVKAAGKENAIKVFGVDMSPRVTQALKTSNDIGAVATQEPVLIGYNAVKEAVLAVEGKTIPKNTYVPVKLITKATLDSFLKTHPYYR